MDKYIGRLLDNRYEILEIIGTGGMAVVYKARCHRLNRLVAIKILKTDYLEDEDFRRRFHAESQAVAMLSHPNIVSVYDVSTSVSLEADYIVMELIEGITLKQYMQTKGFLNWKETLHFGIQIAKALDHAHSRGIVHRDIKPHNVMVLKNGSVKVTDFGIARMMSKGNTLTKEALGSVHYISPEQAKGGRVDSRSDIYSLGVVMYEMMAGRPPYDGDSPVAVAIQHINGGAVMPSVLNPNIPGGLEQIIMKAMANDPSGRYPGAAQMLQDMDEFRKDPTILFDYHTPPLDAVTKLPKSGPSVIDINRSRTTAERVAAQRRNSSSDFQRRQAIANTAAARNTAAKNADAQNRARARAAEERRKREKEEQARNRVALIAIIVCAAVALIAVGIFIAVLIGSNQDNTPIVLVPKLVGEHYEGLAAKHPDIQIKLLDEVYDDVAQAGTVLEQDPEPGTQVEPGRMVFVTVSLGPEPKAGQMGDLTNYTQATAISYLDRLDMALKFRLEEEYHDEIEAGKVIRTEPAAGQPLSEGQQIVLYISLGPEIKTGFMPNILDIPQDLAERTLQNQDLDLVVDIQPVYDDEIEEGNVVRTDPERGDELKTGQSVTLYISKGPQMEEMPELTGKTLAEATDALMELGFAEPVVEYIYSEEAENTVLTQSVEKGQEVSVKIEVKLEVSKGPEPTEPPLYSKDVVINLRGETAEGACRVQILREGNVIYDHVVPHGQETVVLEGQNGNGPVTYTVIVNDAVTWEVQEEFTA